MYPQTLLFCEAATAVLIIRNKLLIKGMISENINNKVSGYGRTEKGY